MRESYPIAFHSQTRASWARHRTSAAGIPEMRSILILCLIILAGPLRLAGAEPAIDFDREVRPILADRCFKCHGPDENERQAELRLDRPRGDAPARPSRDVRRSSRASRPRVVCIRRISSTQARASSCRPPDSGKTLSAAEKELLRRWIEQGAAYRPHWSFVPPARPAVPAVKDAAWPRARSTTSSSPGSRPRACGPPPRPTAPP